MWQAIIIASFCEFGGAYLLGGRVTATIRGGIATEKGFLGHDDLMMFGMLVVVIVATVWVFAATFVELPVSITHTVVGCITGFALCSPLGSNSINWNNLGLVIGSWFISPALSAIISFSLFFTLRKFIFRTENSFRRAILLFPAVVALTVTVCMIFIFFKAGISTGSGLALGTTYTISQGLGICFGVGIGSGILSLFTVTPLLNKILGSLTEEQLRVIAYERGNVIMEVMHKDETLAANIANAKIDQIEDGKIADVPGNAEKTKQAQMDDLIERASSVFAEKQYSLLDRMFHQPMIDKAVFSSGKVIEMHQSGETFDLRTELAFAYLQIFTACFGSFAHGSNDVANSAGPMSSIVSIFQQGSGEITAKTPVPEWVLLTCCVGLVVGLALYGHHIIAAMGTKLVKLTPTRGFSAELSYAFVVVFASFLEIPVSTTQCIVGAILVRTMSTPRNDVKTNVRNLKQGIGLAEFRPREAINWRYFGYTMTGWIVTLFINAFAAAAIFSFVTFAPSQVFPLSGNNCLKYYGAMQNVSAAVPSPSSFVVDSVNGTLIGMYGYPATGYYTAIQ